MHNDDSSLHNDSSKQRYTALVIFIPGLVNMDETSKCAEFCFSKSFFVQEHVLLPSLDAPVLAPVSGK